METPTFVKVDLKALGEWCDTLSICLIILSLFLIRRYLNALDEQDNMIARAVNGLSKAQGERILAESARIDALEKALEEKGNGNTSD